MIKKITLAIILLFTLVFNVNAEKVNFFDEAKSLMKMKNMKIQNFYFKEILYTIPKTQSHIYIQQKYLKMKKTKQNWKKI